ncbi:Ras-like protein 1 [Entamoeba marina]
MENSTGCVVVIGDRCVGKTSIITRKIYSRFDECYSPTIEYHFNCLIEVNNKNIALEIFDTGGNEPFYKTLFNDSFLSELKNKGFVMVYSITDRESFKEVTTFFEHLLRYFNLKNTNSLPICLVGNKIDLEKERKVSIDEGQELADKWNVEFIECTAKENINVNELFDIIALNILNSNYKIECNKNNQTSFQSCLLC